MKLVLMSRGPRRRHHWQHLWKARNDACFCPFCLKLTRFLTFFTLQDKHNIRTLSLNIKFICTRCETGWKARQRLAILKLVQINCIFTDNVRILYIYWLRSSYVIFFKIWIFVFWFKSNIHLISRSPTFYSFNFHAGQYEFLSCNQYICCTNMLYEYIFALFVLDE